MAPAKEPTFVNTYKLLCIRNKLSSVRRYFTTQNFTITTIIKKRTCLIVVHRKLVIKYFPGHYVIFYEIEDSYKQENMFQLLN